MRYAVVPVPKQAPSYLPGLTLMATTPGRRRLSRHIEQEGGVSPKIATPRHMPIIDDLILLAARMRPPARQGEEMRATDEHVAAIVIEAHPQLVADQPRRHGVEYLAQGEAAGRRHADDHFLVVRGAEIRQRLQSGALVIDPLGVAGIAAADDLVNEAAIGGKIVEVGGAA